MSSALMKQFSVTFYPSAFPFFNARDGSAPPALEEKSAGRSNSLLLTFAGGKKNLVCLIDKLKRRWSKLNSQRKAIRLSFQLL